MFPPEGQSAMAIGQNGKRRIALQSGCVAALLLIVTSPLWLWAWGKPQAPNEPPDLGHVNLDNLIRNKPSSHLGRISPFKGVAIEPYGSAAIRLYHRPHDFWTPPFEATIMVPPRLLHDFYVRRVAADGSIGISAMYMEALLPNLALRTPGNFEDFHSDRPYQGQDVLDVVVGYVQNLGPVPDDWFRQRMRCKDANLEADPAFPGLSINPNNRPSEWGIGMWVACQPQDALPDGNEPLVQCSKDRTGEFIRCTVELVLPWSLYGPDVAQVRAPRIYQRSGSQVTSTSGSGIAVIYDFPARHLPEWRRMRDLSLCLVEATVVTIRELAYPGRNGALCSEIKQAIADRKDFLAPLAQ
jgi:hypothetical protein